MYPFGHISVILPLIKKIESKYLLALILFAILPDIDFFLPMEHHGFTHSIFFLVLIVGVTFPIKLHRYALVGTATHIFIDSLSESGVMLFFPLKNIFRLELISLKGYILVFPDDIAVVSLNREIEWFIFSVCVIFFLLFYLNKDKEHKILATTIVLFFFISGTTFYASLKNYEEFPTTLKFEGGDIIEEHGVASGKIKINSYYESDDHASLRTSHEYLKFDISVKVEGTYGLELLSRGIPTSSLLTVVDGEVYRTEVNSREYEWNKLGAFHLTPGRHGFSIRQFDTRSHNSDIDIKKIRIIKVA